MKRIQSTSPLLPEDRSYKRKRYHVLVDLTNEHCAGSELVLAEIGAYEGYTSAHLVKYCPQIARIYAVDLVDPGPEKSQVDHLDKAEFIQAYSDEAAKNFDDESFDLVFIDADHSESWVLRDLAAWTPKVRPGGVISGHDYGSHTHTGVKLAVDAFFERHPHPIRLEANKVWWTLK